MRIAQVVASYYPQLGGVQTHVRQLAEGCAAAGDDVTVLTHQHGTEPAEEVEGGVRVLRFPRTVRSAAYPLSPGLFRYLRRHAGGFDVVHAHSYHTLSSQAAARSGRPVVFTPHYHGTGHTPLAAALHRAYRPAGARLFAAARAVICVSAAERELVVRDFPAAAGKAVVIPNGTVAPPAARTPGPAPGQPPLVLTVGRLERYKNVDLVIRAVRALPSAATLVVAGTGPDMSRLGDVARSGEPGWPVRFAGRVPDAELAALFAQASVVTSASDHEAFGLVLADGLLAGARVVASGIPAHREVGELAGPGAPVTFADPRDTPRFAAALEAALRLGRVPAGRVRLPSWADVTGLTRDVYARAGSAASLLTVPADGAC
jgi:glycosyltransferase involved in cell wall biosynthesis